MARGPLTQTIAAFLLDLPAERAAKVVNSLGEDVVADVAEAMTQLESTNATPEKIEELRNRLATAVGGQMIVRACGPERLQEMLSGALGDGRAQAVVDAINERRILERPFLEIEEEPADRIAAVLKDESAAVSALVLAHLEPALSASVLALFESDFAVDVVRRMASLKPPGFNILRSICADLRERLEGAGREVAGPPAEDRLKTIAEVLNYSSAEMERSVLEGLEEDTEVVGSIREFMFTWDDIGTIDKRSMQKILGTVDTKTLSVALKACSPEVEANIMDNLSARVSEMVREERELAGAVAMSEVNMAREEILRGVRGLIEAGEFSPARAGEELVD